MALIRKIERNNWSTSKLIDGCKQKDPKSQKMIFEQFAPLIFTTCRRYATANYPSKDILQDTFIKVFEKIDQFDENKGQLKSWITRIAINLALNAIKKEKKSIIESNAEIPTHLADEDNEAIDTNLSEEEILTLISNLPVGYKTIFNLFVIDGFSHREIAQKLGIAVSTSKSQLHKAKQMLQQQITQITKEKYG